MDYTTQEWLNLGIRWFHVFAAILWIGQTWFFTWLDHRLSDPAEGGEVWMVHSGGFYVVKKQQKPELTRALHWFRYEALLTWISGLSLFIVVYYMGGLLVDPNGPVTLWRGIGYSIGLMTAGWFIYDLLWISPLGKNEIVGATISFLLLVGLAWLSMRLFTARAAYLQVGATMGTLMAWNVWARILPAQRRMIAATREGTALDPRLGAIAKGRSKHNTFMVLPLVLIMLSNHFPVATYGNPYRLPVLAGIILVGWIVAKFLRSR